MLGNDDAIDWVLLYGGINAHKTADDCTGFLRTTIVIRHVPIEVAGGRDRRRIVAGTTIGDATQRGLKFSNADRVAGGRQC